MSVSVHINNNLIACLNNNTKYIPDKIKSINNEIMGCELKVNILDMNSGNFHAYIFDYTPESKFSPKEWILINIIYSLTCPETKQNMAGLFDNLIEVIAHEINY